MKWKVKNIPNYLEPQKVVMIKNGISSEVPFEIVGDYLVLSEWDANAEYHLRYRPRIDRVTAATPAETYVDIAEGIAAYIPYFVMGELYKHDEPNMAAEMRNEYEQHMLTLKPVTENKQTEVADDMNLGWF